MRKATLFAPPGDMPPVRMDNFFASLPAGAPSSFFAGLAGGAPNFSSRTSWFAVWVCEMRVLEHQRPGGLDHPAHQVKAIADHRAREAVTRHRHGRQREPRIDRRVVGLDAVKRADHTVGCYLAARHIDQACPSVPQAPPLRAYGIRSLGTFHESFTGLYSSTTSVLVAVRMKPWPVRPPMT